MADGRPSTYQEVSDFTDGVTAHQAIAVNRWVVNTTAVNYCSSKS